MSVMTLQMLQRSRSRIGSLGGAFASVAHFSGVSMGKSPAPSTVPRARRHASATEAERVGMAAGAEEEDRRRGAGEVGGAGRRGTKGDARRRGSKRAALRDARGGSRGEVMERK